MKTVRPGCALALATFAALAQAHGEESHPMKKHSFDASKVEERASARRANGTEMGSRKDPYQVLLVDKQGRERVFSSYN